MKGFSNTSRRAVIFLALVVSGLTMAPSGPCYSQETGPGCASVVGPWEQVYRDLKAKLAELKSLEQAPASRFINKPLVDPQADKTIARQVSEALEAKEALLETRRKECQYLVELEKTLFSKAEPCLQSADAAAKRSKNAKNSGRNIKERNSLVNEAAMVMVNVKEVDGKEQFYPEEGGYPPNPMDPSMGGQRSAWQNYMNMYRGFWQ